MGITDNRRLQWCTGRFRRLSAFARMLFGLILLSTTYFFVTEMVMKSEKKVDQNYMSQFTEIPGQKHLADNFFNRINPIDSDAVDTHVADALRSKVRVLCLILTTERFFESRAKAVRHTWAKRCDKYFFALKTWRRSPNIINTNFSETRYTIVYKMRQAITHVYTHYAESFDWLLKADDDTYVIIENLRYLLSNYNSEKPGYLGYHYNKFITSGFMSGGAGYALSKAAVRMLVMNGLGGHLCDVKHRRYNLENGEDLEIGHCLQKVGVPVLSSLDSRLRETFHPNSLDNHLFGNLPVYVYDMAMNTPQTGPECCSRFAVSYHYVTPEMMAVMEHLLYKTSVYGRDLRADGNSSEPVFKVGTVKPKS